MHLIDVDELIGLIDNYINNTGDAIKNGFSKQFVDGMVDGYSRIKSAVVSSPSVEINVGKWLPYEFGDYHWHKCSVCGTADKYIDTVDRSDRGYGKSDLESVRNYCPVCGSKMVN